MTGRKWTEIFASLPDAAFFEVVRHYLGPVKTPFHKPDLVARMEAFFRRDDVNERFLSFIDEDDARLLTIIGYLEGVTGGRLAGMVPDLRYVVLREKLLNLEERLLVWSRPSGRVRHYTLTPLGEEVMDAGLTGPGSIVGEGIPGESKNTTTWLDDNFLNCALAFLSEEQTLFRKEGGWRKKTLEKLASAFPKLFEDSLGEDRLLLAGRGLLSMGLVERRGESLIPVLSLWRELEQMDSADRLLLLRARAAVGRSVSPENAVAALKLFSEELPAAKFYEPSKLATLFQLASGNATLSPVGARRVIAHLELMGVLNSNSMGQLGRSDTASASGQLMTITPVGDITLQPGSTLFCNLALVAGVGRLDVLASFTLDKTGYQSGLENSVETDRLFEEIELRSGRPVPENLRTQCREWESDHRELNLQVGVILRAEGLRKEILESTGALEPYAISKPAPGIWILDPDSQELWRNALSEVGMERLPKLTTPSGTIWDIPSSRGNQDRTNVISWTPTIKHSLIASSSWNHHVGADISSVLADLKKAARDVGLSSDEMTAFEERLERRVILVKDQIKKGAWRFEVMSAKGLDYRGKIRLAEAALSGRDERLAVSVAVGNDIETILVLPEKIEKDGDDHVLVGISLPEEAEVRFKIRKIGLLKRIKASLF